ncbi:MAG TPA: hypothetical protein VFH51_06120 [Myxococcota bacterium]|nr:hypothetical protein [Myxococcota bacterium]
MRLRSLALLLGSLTGCLSENAHYEGTINGEKFEVADAAYVSKRYPAETQRARQEVLVNLILLSTTYSLCQDIGAQVLHPRQRFLLMTTVTPTGAQTTSPLPLPEGWPHVMGGLNSACDTLPNTAITRGTITLKGADYAKGENAEGTFEINLASGDHGTGTFDASACPAMETFTDEVVAIANGDTTRNGLLIHGACR